MSVADRERMRARCLAQPRPPAKGPPNPRAVTFERGVEIRAEWERITESWIETAPAEAIAERFETFLPDHPEWLEYAK